MRGSPLTISTMKLIKIIIDHKECKVFGMVEKQEGDRFVKDYTGFILAYKESQKVIDNKSITIYDLRL